MLAAHKDLSLGSFLCVSAMAFLCTCQLSRASCPLPFSTYINIAGLLSQSSGAKLMGKKSSKSNKWSFMCRPFMCLKPSWHQGWSAWYRQLQNPQRSDPGSLRTSE